MEDMLRDACNRIHESRLQDINLLLVLLLQAAGLLQILLLHGLLVGLGPGHALVISLLLCLIQGNLFLDFCLFLGLLADLVRLCLGFGAYGLRLRPGLLQNLLRLVLGLITLPVASSDTSTTSATASPETNPSSEPPCSLESIASLLRILSLLSMTLFSFSSGNMV